MKATTKRLWELQDRHQGDRWRLFSAVAREVGAEKVLYPGCFVDIAPSFIYPDVTYLDQDKRTPSFFGDEAGVLEILAEHGRAPNQSKLTFVYADYQAALGLNAAHYDLLVSLYAGFVSEHCTQYLRVGGYLLVNPSHGDAAMASIDPRYQLSGVVISNNADYRVSTSNLDAYLIPKKAAKITSEQLHKSGRGVAYTKSAFAYLFQRIC